MIFGDRHATAIMPEVNLHRILPPLQDNYQSPIPNFQILILHKHIFPPPTYLMKQ